MNKKRVISLLLVMVLVVASMSVVHAGSYSWDDDWNSSVASAWGGATCDAYGADAETYCFELIYGATISTSAYADGYYEYRDADGNAIFESAYEDDATRAEVSFSVSPSAGETSICIDYYYRASFTAYGEHGEAYTETYSGSKIVSGL